MIKKQMIILVINIGESLECTGILFIGNNIKSDWETLTKKKLEVQEQKPKF